MARLILILVLLVSQSVQAQQVPASSAQMQLSFVPVVKQVTPAVVNIYAKIITKPRSTPLQRDPFFERFFLDPEHERPRVQNSLGSGVIIGADGIVVSNHHVVGSATDIRVVLSDRREFSARVLLADATSDLAILQLEGPGDLPFLPLRPSDSVEVGELALAIGNPFGVGQTVSSGIISGLARSGTTGGDGLGYFIQTDAPINPGNSGGALVDTQGRLIGINTSILTRSGGSNGIGFAIPADLVGAFMAQARKGAARFLRPWAGLSGQPVDADISAGLGLDRPEGIVVSGIHGASPFAEVDVRVGDVITKVNGQPVNTPSEMVYRMSVVGLGNRAVIERLRNGRARQLEVALQAPPENPPRDLRRVAAPSVLEGLEVLTINPAVMTQYRLPLDADGVMIVQTGRLGARVGLRTGDRILEINGRAIQKPEDVANILETSGRSFAITVLRGGQRIALQFRV
jgi:Do/DeqQ family serine protease